MTRSKKATAKPKRGDEVYASQFSELFDKAMRSLKLKNSHLHRKTNNDGSGEPPIDPKTLGQYRKKTFTRDVGWERRRRLERAMGVFNEYLEGHWPEDTPYEQHRLVLINDVPKGAEYPPPFGPERQHAGPEVPEAPSLVQLDNQAEVSASAALRATLEFLRGQLEGYKRDSRPIPYLIAESWLAEIEAVASARAPDLGPDAGGSGSGSPATAPPRHTSRAQ